MSGCAGQPDAVYAFGDDTPQMADDLLALILAGRKKATATRLAAYIAENEPVPQPGDLALILDGAGKARCVIQTTRIDLVPFDEVTEEFAYTEGEGDRSLEWWRDAHLAFFNRECAQEGTEFSHQELIVCERFDCVWPPTQ